MIAWYGVPKKGKREGSLCPRGTGRKRGVRKNSLFKKTPERDAHSGRARA